MIFWALFDAMKFSHTIDEAIVAAVTAKYGSARVSVVPQFIPERPGAPDAGDWYVLAINGEVLGRRRSKVELIEMIERKAVE